MDSMRGPDRILVLDGDDPRLKGAFADRMVREFQKASCFREVGRVNAVLDRKMDTRPKSTCGKPTSST